jgi:hypothetical protein
MTTISVWLLIAVSAGIYNQGTVASLERFPTREACVATMNSIDSGSTRFYCVPATVVK